MTNLQNFHSIHNANINFLRDIDMTIGVALIYKCTNDVFYLIECTPVYSRTMKC